MNNKNNMWPILSKPPVALAVFQIKFSESCIEMDEYKSYFDILHQELPLLFENITGKVNINGTPAIGITKVSATTNNRLESYILSSQDQKIKLELGHDSFTYNDENQYSGWDKFAQNILHYLDILEKLLVNKVVARISIRFINKFIFEDFQNPTDYFKTIISSTDKNGFVYPLLTYGFRFTLQVPNTSIYSIIHHNVDKTDMNQYLYILDIDVINNINLIYTKQSIVDSLKQLRGAKNNIFFDTITSKTIELCN